ncbi:MAG: hypothetical protein JSV03_00585, partial [Planctomycetota bacterium]
MIGFKNSTVLFMLAMALLSAEPVMAVLNNGFETDYFYTATRYDEIQIFDESVRVGDPEVGVLGSHGRPRSITFSGTGTADARLFMLEYDDDYWNAFIRELNSAGAIVNTGDLQTLAGHGNYDGIFGQTIRFNPFGDSGAGSLMAALIEKWDDIDEPLTIYEIDLDLTTILNTYTGPMVGRVEASVAVDPLTGTLYVVAGRNSAADPIDTTVCDDVIAFDTSGGSTSTYTTVVDASDPVYGYTAPDSVIFRSACAGNSYTPTILVVRNDKGPAREYRASDGVWVRDYEDIKDESGNFRMNAGHQDMMNLDIYISTYARNHFIINTDNTVDNWAYGDTGWSSYRDAVSPGFGSAPVIAEVTPDPDEGYANVEYTEQLTTAECFPLPTWSVTANTTAPGVQVDGNGLVSGWTPAPGDLGSSFVIEIQASNASGSDTETWQVQVEDWPPSIAEVAPDPDDVDAGSEYTEQLTLQQGFHSVTWSLITWPTGAVIDPNTGLVSGWTPSDSDVNNSFNFEALASNPYGSDTEAWQVQVNAVAPTIGDIPWSPHLTQVNTEYVVQLSATGTTPITWSKVQGPAAMKIDGTGRISGWTPDLCDVGSTIPIEIKAGNLAIGGGEDTATWNVIVCSNLNNGFNLDYVYGASRDGRIPMYDENNRDSDPYIADFGGTGQTYFGEGGGRLSSITFTGTGANDA